MVKILRENNKNFAESFKKILRLDKSKKIVLTNYSFFSVLTEENVSGYSRWYPGDNSAFPKKGNKYFPFPVARTGFEPVISALRGRRPKPLDERALSNNYFLVIVNSTLLFCSLPYSVELVAIGFDSP